MAAEKVSLEAYISHLGEWHKIS